MGLNPATGVLRWCVKLHLRSLRSGSGDVRLGAFAKASPSLLSSNPNRKGSFSRALNKEFCQLSCLPTFIGCPDFACRFS